MTVERISYARESLAAIQTSIAHGSLSTSKRARLIRDWAQCCPTLGRFLEHRLTRECFLLLSAGRAEIDKALKFFAPSPPD